LTKDSSDHLDNVSTLSPYFKKVFSDFWNPHFSDRLKNVQGVKNLSLIETFIIKWIMACKNFPFRYGVAKL